MLDFLLEFAPNPNRTPGAESDDGCEVIERPITDKEHVTAYVFKTIADPFAGRLSFFKVCSGVLKNDASLISIRAGSVERLAHLSVLRASNWSLSTSCTRAISGSWPAEGRPYRRHVVRKGRHHSFPKVGVQEPSIAYAIGAKSRNDEDRMGNALQRILEEDPGLRFYRDPQTKDFLLAGSGGQHVEIVVSRLKKRYNVDVELRAPKIPYRETNRGHADVHGRHKKQTGGHGQFGDIKVKVDPLERGEGFKFVNSVFGGAGAEEFHPRCGKGASSRRPPRLPGRLPQWSTSR